MKPISILNTPALKAINILPIDIDEQAGTRYLVVLSMTNEREPGLGLNISVGQPWFHLTITVWKRTIWIQLGEWV